MQDLFGSVRRSLVYRPSSPNTDDDDNGGHNTPSPMPTPSTSSPTNFLVDKINSCIRKSRAFTRLTSPPPSNPPTTIRWRKGELIGSGAFGRVYMGMNLDSGELLAVKQVLIAGNSSSKEKQQAHIRELEEEVKLLKNLSHPNIVRYLGTVREEENLNIFLEFVPGGSISSLLGKFGPFPEAVIRTYTKQLLLGLDYLHSNGIMHRDIKGANILVDNKGQIKLADFGASKQVVELATMSGAKSMKGTPYWMAPEVIRQTGHSFSADIWSVGCTVIEMATGKPPWSEQYKEVAALFYIGSTKCQPEIPEHLSAEVKSFLLQCLQREPTMRPTASELLQCPFVTGKQMDSHPVICTSVMEQSGIPSPMHTDDMQTYHVPKHTGSTDACNLGTLGCTSLGFETPSENKRKWRTDMSDDDMCQMDTDSFVTSEVKRSSYMTPNDFNKSFDPMCELSHDWTTNFDGSAKLEQTEKLDNDQPIPPQNFAELGTNLSVSCGASLSEEDDELTESKIRAFLDEKALELKKLQTPLYEEFYNGMNPSCSPSFVQSIHDETSPSYLRLPPKSKSPNRFPSPSSAIDATSTRSPGSNTSNQTTMQDNSSPQCNNDHKSPTIDQPELTSPGERQRKWKEELDQELERKREMIRQAGAGGKTSSPKDRALNRQREKTRFASPSK